MYSHGYFLHPVFLIPKIMSRNLLPEILLQQRERKLLRKLKTKRFGITSSN